jgi:hypothetical protein
VSIATGSIHIVGSFDMPRAAAIAGVLLSLSAGAMPAGARPIRPMPLRLRIEGYVGEPPAGVVALARWVVAVKADQYTLTVTKLEPSPSAKIAYWDILNALEPLPIAMTLFGKGATLAKFTGTRAGEKIVLDGSFELQRGPASLLLNSVEAPGTPVPAATPPPTGASAGPAARRSARSARLAG